MEQITRRTMMTAAAAAATLPLLPGSARATATDGISLPPAPIPGLTIPPELYPTVVLVKTEFVPGSIIVVSSSYHLYFVVREGIAIRYGVAVGKAELIFRGVCTVGRKVEWPSWKPTPEMIERNPNAYKKYADGMPGGARNPLGARAIYLYQDGHDTAIRIHGTTDPNSIGKSVSNGCLRMVNDHVIDLYDRVALGAQVTVY